MRFVVLAALLAMAGCWRAQSWGVGVLALVALVSLGGCVSGAVAMVQCQHEVGAAPHPDAGLFGLAGAAWSAQQPDTQAYNAAVDQCYRAKMAAQ